MTRRPFRPSYLPDFETTLAGVFILAVAALFFWIAWQSGKNAEDCYKRTCPPGFVTSYVYGYRSPARCVCEVLPKATPR